MNIYPALITEALSGVRYPGNGKSLTENNMIADNIRINGNHVSFSLIFPKEPDPFAKSVVRASEDAIERAIPGVDIKGNISVEYAQKVREKANLLPGVKNIIGVSSGKGGVGKSTVAANLAVALAAKGYKVGLLDADIFGPSVPKMFGIEKEPIYISNEGGVDRLLPVERYGVKLLSIGLVVDPDSPVLWRGSMASNALKQLISEADWGELDYFLIDMPPGTSDIHLTLVQTLAITGAVIVTTPQDVALADARKGIEMFRNPQIAVPMLGLVENMAWFTPEPHPQERYYIFGNGGGKRLCEATGIKLLGQIPLVADLCTSGDSGCPASIKPAAELTASASLTGPIGEAFSEVADHVLASLEERNATLPPTKSVETHS